MILLSALGGLVFYGCIRDRPVGNTETARHWKARSAVEAKLVQRIEDSAQ